MNSRNLNTDIKILGHMTSGSGNYGSEKHRNYVQCYTTLKNTTEGGIQ